MASATQARFINVLQAAAENKHNIQSETFQFAGHTEFFADAFEVKDNLMFLVSEDLRIGVVTGHIPLGKVKASITQEKVSSKITLMLESLKKDFGIQKPKIAVLGLNPHAGEDGLLGNEEKEIIHHAIDAFKRKGHLVQGPFSADGFFGMKHYRKFDGVLAMYHDQGLIPFKLLAFEACASRGVAQPGSVPAWGAGGRWFESSRPDQ